MDFFTSDLHFGHENMLVYNRSGHHDTVGQMDMFIINEWNKKVGKDDTVWVLGDMFMGMAKSFLITTVIIDALNGKINLIPGNHDHPKSLELVCNYYNRDGESKFNIMPRIMKKKFMVEKGKKHKTVIMSHFPITIWEEQGRGSVHLHGHTHCGWHDGVGKILDVGFDSIYSGGPGIWSVQEVFDYMKTRCVVNVDSYH